MWECTTQCTDVGSSSPLFFQVQRGSMGRQDAYKPIMSAFMTEWMDGMAQLGCFPCANALGEEKSSVRLSPNAYSLVNR